MAGIDGAHHAARGSPWPAEAGGAPGTGQPQSIGAALREAMGERGFHLLFWGYFVCGFHIAMLTVHLPSFVTDAGLKRDARHDRARADRPVQHHRHARRRLARRPLQQEVPAVEHLLGARACSSRCWCSCRCRRSTCTCSPAASACCGSAPCRSPTAWWGRSSACATPRCSPRSCSSATRSAASSACGSRATCTTPPAATSGAFFTSIGLGIFAALVNLPVNEKPLAERGKHAQAVA